MKSFVLVLLLVVVRVSQAVSGSGLYIMLRNETTRIVTVRQISCIKDRSSELSSWNVALGLCPVNSEIVSYSAMDTKRHIFVGKLVFNVSAMTGTWWDYNLTSAKILQGSVYWYLVQEVVSVCHWDQESCSVKIVLDHLIIPFRGS